MEIENAKPDIEDLSFIWNHIHSRLQLHRTTEEPEKDLTPDELEEREHKKGNF